MIRDCNISEGREVSENHHAVSMALLGMKLQTIDIAANDAAGQFTAIAHGGHHIGIVVGVKVIAVQEILFNNFLFFFLHHLQE